MHDKTTSGTRGVLTRCYTILVKGDNIRESFPEVRHFRTKEWEEEGCVFAMLGACGGRRAAYSDSSRRSEQLSCIKLFHPSYGYFL